MNISCIRRERLSRRLSLPPLALTWHLFACTQLNMFMIRSTYSTKFGVNVPSLSWTRREPDFRSHLQATACEDP